eukprot:CAMPEP_0196579774 /NCGR_PEP_ID=MMETSP1081-20130531/24688_1 /TAXON_ID=36882 /ORGANISM="Pyramimonas amylifera, Strain CCMP720" /LENGTH=210 /DNA_ID=CAMNT_0041899457 /DNA_START=169 /DNA_END=801 /DNA_ORIENTATION=+
MATTNVADDLYSRQRTILPLGAAVPQVSVDAFVAPSATLIGNVQVVDMASVWYGAVIRGDLNHIRIGAFSNVQDKCVIHAAKSSPTGLSARTNIGGFVTIGAGSIIRSCNIADNVMVGKRCILMEGSEVERDSKLEDGTVLPPGRLIPSGQLWGGNPAQYRRDLSHEEIDAITEHAEQCATLQKDHKGEFFLPYSFAYLEAEKLRASGLI